MYLVHGSKVRSFDGDPGHGSHHFGLRNKEAVVLVVDDQYRIHGKDGEVSIRGSGEGEDDDIDGILTSN